MAAMPDIDLQTPIQRRLDHRVDFAFAIDEASGMARERMRQYVTFPQQRDDPRQDSIYILPIGAAFGQAPELTEMEVDRQIGAASDFGRHLDNANAPAREPANFGMRLDAANQIWIRRRGLHGGVDID